jgi:hypothetical protein
MFIEIYCIRWKWFSWKVIHFGLKKLSFRSVTIKNGAMGKGMPSCTVLWEMLTRAFNQTNFWLIFFVFFASNNKQLQYGTFVHVVFYKNGMIVDYFSRKSLSTNTINFNKHDINIFINDKWLKYTGYIGRLFKITRWLELRCAMCIVW